MVSAYWQYEGVNLFDDIVYKCSVPAIAVYEDGKLLCYWEGEDKFSDKLKSIKQNL